MMRMLNATVALAVLAGVSVWPRPAAAQDVRVVVDVKTRDFVREIMQAVHDAIDDDAIRDVTRIVTRDLGRDLGREIGASFRGIPFSHAGAWVAPQNRDFKATAEDRQTKTLALGASGSLELHNVGGAITVAVTSGTSASIEIVRTSHGRTDADAKTGLEKVTVDVAQVGERATIRTKFPDERRPPYSVDVAYHVKAPAGTKLTIDNIGGDIVVTDMKGGTSASSTGGGITITGGSVSSAHSVGGKVTLTNTETDGSLSVETFGSEVVLKQVKARRVTVTNVGGHISADGLTCDTADLGNTGGDIEFTGTIAKGGRYELHNTGGNIRFAPLGPVGYELQASTFAGDVRAQGITLASLNSGRGPNRTLKGTVGDGSALVILRTLSGQITIGK